MALTRTTLTAAITTSQTTFGVASTATGFPVVGTVAANQPLMIDDETMFLTGVLVNIGSVRERVATARASNPLAAPA